jgi:hypothetical protein
MGQLGVLLYSVDSGPERYRNDRFILVQLHTLALSKEVKGMIFVKGLLGGAIAVVVMWFGIVAVDMWCWAQISRQRGDTGLGAVAGGWNHLLHMPLVVILLGGL